MVKTRSIFHRILVKLLIITVLCSSLAFIAAPGVKAYPYSLTLTVLSSTQVRLDWSDTTDNLYDYYIEKKTDSGSFLYVQSVSKDTRTYTDGNITTGHIYAYRIGVFDVGLNTTVYTNEIYYNTNIPTLTSPNSLELTAFSSTQIDLYWTYSVSASCKTKIERRDGDYGSWKEIAIAASGVTKYSDTNLTPNTKYYYRITGVYESNTLSVPYPTDGTGKQVYTKLLKPVSVSGTYSENPQQILLTWISQTAENKTFTVERKTGSGEFSVVGTTALNTHYWVDSNLSQGNRYVYRIKASTDTSVSEYSDEYSIMTTYLVPPTGLTASSVSASKIKLTWYDNSTNETGFEIWRRTAFTENWEKVAVTGPNITSHTDQSLSSSSDAQYYYKIRAMGIYNTYSDYSSEANIQSTQLPSPGNLQYAANSKTEVTLTWTDNSTNETGFKVERKASSAEDWEEIINLSEDTTSYTVTGLTENTQYLFRIKAVNSIYSLYSYSDVIEVSTGTPKAPSNLTAEVLSQTRVRLNWTDSSDNELGFKIERASSGSHYTLIAQTDANATAYTDTGLQPDIRYYYRVSSFNHNGSSEYSSGVSATTKTSSAFTDLENVPWARAAIEDLASRGVMTGKTSVEYYPDDVITRAEFVTAVIRAFKFARTPVGSFLDVNSNHWAYRELMTARVLGIVGGSSQSYFYPDEPVAREDMALILTKTLRIVEKPLPAHDASILNKYTDVWLIAPAALSSIASLNGENILQGKTADTINPKDSASRAEAAVMLYKVIDR